VVVTLVSIPKF